MTEKELIDKAQELEAAGKTTQVYHRVCNEADIEGLRKIIRENTKISFFKVIPKNPPWLDFIGCDEYFYTTSDEEFNRFGREKILAI